MADCGRCGAPDQAGRFCVNCGAPMSPPGQPVDLGKAAISGRVGPTDPTVLAGSIPQPEPNPGPTAAYPAPLPTAPQLVPAGPPRGRRGAAILVALAVVVLLAAGAGVWFLLRPVAGEGTGIAGGTALPPASATATSGTGTEPAGGTGRPVPVVPPGSKGEPSSSSAAGSSSATGTVPPSTVTTVATTTVGLDPMGGPRADIACGSGFIVQVASELDQPAFAARVAALRGAGALPADLKWAETASSCPIFTSQSNVLVLYAGPYPSVDAACPARLASPADAFVKAADPAAVGTFRSCLCPASAGALPAITSVGQQGVWVGELQRVLGSGLQYDIGSINADPSIGDPGRWGIYTAETAAAVGRFQADHGLPATQQVDAATWSALQSARCGHE